MSIHENTSLLACVLIALLAACGDDASDACVTDEDCASLSVCVDGLCVVRDERDADVLRDTPVVRDGGPDAEEPMPDAFVQPDGGPDAGAEIDASVLTCGEACDTGMPCIAGIVDCSGEPQCVPRDAPTTLVEDRTIIANNSSFPGTYNGRFDDFQRIADPPPWPGRVGESIRLSLTANEFIAASFNSGDRNFEGRFQLAASGNFEGPPTVGTTLSISECPGDFATHLNQEACLGGPGSVSSLRWSHNPEADRTRFCVLDRNTDYYLNIVHSRTAEDGFTTSACNFPYCGVLATQIFSEL